MPNEPKPTPLSYAARERRSTRNDVPAVTAWLVIAGVLVFFLLLTVLTGGWWVLLSK